MKQKVLEASSCGVARLREDVEEEEEGGAVLFLVSGELEKSHGDGGGR